MDDYRDLHSLFSAHLARYENQLKGRQPSELYDPEAYILSLGGKRLRPLLALIGCDLFDGDPATALDSALAVELFHNFSLIHDDILDAAPLRRGKETVHLKWNQGVAILSGDVMLVKSFICLGSYPADQCCQLSRLLQDTAVEVCEGQQMDMNFESARELTVDDYLQMITLKTAVLLGCSLQMGAVCAGAGQDAQRQLHSFGKNLGVAFQLNDDLLDAFSEDSDRFGKQRGGDIIANKKTYLLLKAREKANTTQLGLIDDILGMPDKTEKVNAMLRVYDQLGVKQLCMNEADAHTQLAIRSLDELQVDAEKKDRLQHFANQLLTRKI